MEKDLEKGKTASLREMEAILISKGFHLHVKMFIPANQLILRWQKHLMYAIQLTIRIHKNAYSKHPRK